MDPAATTRAVEWNDLPSVEAALADRQVAVLLTEPVLTNIGIVLPEPGLPRRASGGVRPARARSCSSTRRTPCRPDPGGAPRPGACEPDLVTLGKSFAGGVPIGAYGLSTSVADRLGERVEAEDADLVDVGGVGGTLAGNALSMAAARATLAEVLTPAAFEGMIERATRFTAGVQGTLDRHELPVERGAARRPGRVPLRPPRSRAPAPSPPPPVTTRSRSSSTWRWPTAASCSRRSTTWR